MELENLKPLPGETPTTAALRIVSALREEIEAQAVVDSRGVLPGLEKRFSEMDPAERIKMKVENRARYFAALEAEKQN